MLKKDIIDGKEYEDGQGSLIADLDHSIQQMLKTSYPESQMDDFITVSYTHLNLIWPLLKISSSSSRSIPVKLR